MAVKAYIKVAAGLFLAAAFTAAAVVILVPRLMDLDTYKPQILSLAQKALNRRASYDAASFSWHFGPAFVFHNITVAEKNGKQTFLQVNRLTFRLALLPLLHKEVRLREIVVERPVVMLDRNRAGVFNIDDLLAGKPSGFSLFLKSVRIENARVRFTDFSGDPTGFTASLENLDLYARKLARGKTSEFKLSTRITGEREEAAVSISGSARIPAQEESLSDAKFDVALSVKNLDPGRYWPYYGRYLPFERVRGVLDIEGVFKGKPVEFTTKGNLRIRDLGFNYPQVFHSILTPRDVRLTYDAELTPRDFAVKSFSLFVDGLRATGSCVLGDIHTSDPRITARAVTSPFRLEEFRQYIPYGVIVKGPADFIEQHVIGGLYKLDEGRLDGRVSQILHMERGNNYNVLYIRGWVEKGLVTFGPHVPTFNNIKGDLEMRGKDFLLQHITANFGGSPFALEGKIADYPLDTPSHYPFIMTITPREAEVAWLLRQQEHTGLIFRGNSLLQLSGDGSTSDYRLAGAWDLTPADYGYRRLAHKPRGTANRLRFSARLGKTEARLEDFRYELPPVGVKASATYRYDAPIPLTFAVATNRFMINPILPIFPGLQKYRPSGWLHADVGGSGDPAKKNGIRVKGDVTVEKFSVRPLEHFKPLTGITGTIHVTEDALETERLTGRLGQSVFTAGGHVAGGAHPSADLVFSTPELHLEDFGFHATGEVPEVKNLSGSISLNDGRLTIASLSGEVRRTKFTMSGEVPDIGTPNITIRADFPYLRGEDIVPLSRLRRAGGDQERAEGIVLTARVTSAAGSMRDIPFENLDTELYLDNDRLDVRSLRVGVFSGSVSGSGAADFAADGGPTYWARYHLDHIDTARLVRATGAKPHLTGSLSADGALAARGKTWEELKRTIHVTAGLHMREGEIIAFPSANENEAVHIPYNVLDANLSLAEDVLNVQWMKAGLFGGTVSGNGRVDFAADGGPTYLAHYRLDHIDASRLLHATGAAQQLAGVLAGEGEVSFRGTDGEALRNSVKGDAEILLTEGLLHLPESDELKTAHDIPFKKVQARLSFDRKKLDIQSVSIEAFGGIITGKVMVDLTVPNGPGYRLVYNLQNIDAADFFHAFDVTRELSGRLNLQGELAARGDGVVALQKTLEGTIAIHLEKGVIKRYGFISKVFSVLNVSQLLDFRLPDVMTSGMPYDKIDGTYYISEGRVSTFDLTIRSQSMNMTIVGNADIVSREINAKIAVQPLQTLGKIVSRIPVIGWLLTGEKKRFLVVYYEAKGKWDDPTVTATPVSSLSRGILNIFKRILNLPDDLITNPGKVILGN